MRSLSIGFAIILSIYVIAWWYPLWALFGLLAWCGLSAVCVSLAYAKGWGSLFRKNNGAIPQTIRWVFFPYLAAVQVYNVVVRARDSAPPMNNIGHDVYVGSRLFPRDVTRLQKENIVSVLDVTAEFDGLGSFSEPDTGIHYLNIPVLDHTAPKPLQIAAACRWIEEQHNAGRAVLIHCALGRGRSVFIAAAYLLARGYAKNVDEALEKIANRRCTARLNKRQKRGLNRWFEGDTSLVRPKLKLIVNPVAGSHKWDIYKNEIVSLLDPHFDVSISKTREDYGPADIVKDALSEGYRSFVACGGDGTVSETAGAIVDKNCQLGIIPMGTANALAHVFFGWQSKVIPVYSSCDAIIAGNVRTIDTALCNDELMLLAVGVGLEEHMIRSANREEKTSLGTLAYIKGFAEGLGSGAQQEFRLTLDDDSLGDVRTQSLMIANAAPATTLLAQGLGEPNFEDGRLDVTWFNDSDGDVGDGIAAVGELAYAVVTESVPATHISHRAAQRVKVEGRQGQKLPYVLDGEWREAETIVIAVRPQSLSVFAPDPPVKTPAAGA